MSSSAPPLATLAEQCRFASHFWRLVFGGLTAIVYRQLGTEAFQRVRVAILGHHQTGHYREGLRKLGIGDDEPPAVAAAKYHYLSNSMGGLGLQYVEESPRKVWLRYIGPMWTFPGMTMLALPSTMRRADFTAWHPRNGVFMGCPRLGWVSTKSISEGDPYDEGYFQEYDHDLSDAERMRYETVLSTPECDPAKLPVLDPAAWPEARKLRTLRKFAGEYVESTVEVIGQLYGEREAAFVVSQAMSMLAAQYTAELAEELGCGGGPGGGAAAGEGNRVGVAAVADFFVMMLRAFDQSHEVVARGGDEVCVRVEGVRPFRRPVPSRIRDAYFDFQRTATRILDGHVEVTRSADPASLAETWRFRDTGRWLW